MLSEIVLRRMLSDRGLSPALFVTEETGSTNNDAKDFAKSAPSAPALFVTDRQTAGRGRQGKTFVSPPGGLYMSLLLPAEIPSSGAVGVTGCAAVAVCRAVEECARIPARIKWVNDVLIRTGPPRETGVSPGADGTVDPAAYGKAAGILCEATGTAAPYLVIGVGVNVTSAPVVEGANFPPAAVFSASSPAIPRHPAGHAAETLCTSLTEQLLAMAEDGFRFSDVSAEYRARSIVAGRMIDFVRNGVTRSGFVRSVADDGSLLLETAEGPLILDSGEISVRLR